MLKIAIQGIETSFHEVAAKKHFGENITTHNCWTFTELCESLANDKSDFAVMAIENSIAGSLLQNYGLLQDYNFSIIGEVYLRIEMNLMALPGQSINDISTVQSHPIALRQCSKYLNSLSNTKLIEREDTAGSAKEIAANNLKGYAAVANIAAAKRFGLDVLKTNIETNKNNFTRFVILSKKPVSSENNNKATVFLSLPHDPGSLAKVLTIFSSNNINLTKIQSVPIVGKPYNYNFHLDIIWDNYKDFTSVKNAVSKLTTSFFVLGEYKHVAYSA